VAKKINRGHSFECFLETYKKLKERNVRVCVHLINGLPGENFDMMVQTAKTVGALKPDAVKIHLLHIMQGTVMHKQFLNGEFEEMAFDDYIKTVCTQLTVLPAETVIERITGDGSKDKLVAPLWSKDKIRVLGTIDKYMADNDLYQCCAVIN
jgi:radical SAM protein (TIGR01212 family)